ncbi:MAG: hypothetical protein ACPGVD_03595 [Flavobacteriales bacterium]
MKRLLLFAFAFATILSCKKANELTQFDIDYSNSIIIPASSGINLPFNVFSPDIETNSDTKFHINDTRKDKIERIELKKLNLELKSPSTSSFKFLKSVEIYLQADGLNDVKVAWKENIPETVGKTLSLNVSNQDFKAFILKEEFNIRVRTVTDEIITSDHEIEVNSTFFVDAKVL